MKINCAYCKKELDEDKSVIYMIEDPETLTELSLCPDCYVQTNN
jgi:hypothetical protein